MSYGKRKRMKNYRDLHKSDINVGERVNYTFL